MKNLKFILLICLLILAAQSFSQGVGINNDGSSADPSAILDVKSTDMGMLVPRLTTALRTGILSPANSLLVYDTDTQSFWFYRNSAWVEITPGLASEIRDADGDTKVTVMKETITSSGFIRGMQ